MPSTPMHRAHHAQVEVLATGEVCFTVLAVAPTLNSTRCNGAAVLKKLEIKTCE